MAGRMRLLAERLARGRRVRRTLPNGAAIMVSPDSQLKYLRGQFDADLVALARDRVKPADMVWDIGANCGVFAFSAGHARRVVAVEPDPFLVDLLLASSALNALPVEVVAAAIDEQPGMATLVIAARGRASNHLEGSGHAQTGGGRSRLNVPTLTLDMLLDRFGPPALVKIDIEGLEMAALRGGARLLAEAKPLLYLELVPQVVEECRAHLHAAGYRLQHMAEMNWLAEPADSPSGDGMVASPA